RILNDEEETWVDAAEILETLQAQSRADIAAFSAGSGGGDPTGDKMKAARYLDRLLALQQKAVQIDFSEGASPKSVMPNYPEDEKRKEAAKKRKQHDGSPHHGTRRPRGGGRR